MSIEQLIAFVVEHVKEFVGYIVYFFEMIKAIPTSCFNLFMQFLNFPFPFNFILVSVGLVIVVIIFAFLINLCYSLITFFIGGDS